MLALVYLIDAMLAPIGFLAVLASEVHEDAYLLAIAPAALLGLIARERSGAIAHELELERAFRRSTRALDARADDLRRQAGRRPARRRRARGPRALERILLATTVEALQADAGRLSEIDDDGMLHARLAIGDAEPGARAGRAGARLPAGERARDRRRAQPRAVRDACRVAVQRRSSATCSSTSPRRPR